MAGSTVLVDTGPLVALFNRRDSWHGWVKEILADRREPLLTCDAVLSEATFFLNRDNENNREKGTVRRN